MADVLAVVFMTQKIIFVTVAAPTAAAAAVIGRMNQIRSSQDELNENVPKATTHTHTKPNRTNTHLQPELVANEKSVSMGTKISSFVDDCFSLQLCNWKSFISKNF